MEGYKAYVTARIGPAMTARTGDGWQDRSSGHYHICKDLRRNFIDGEVPVFCALKGNLFADVKLHYHRWSRCLTSSQVLCISFFKKFFERPEDEAVLLALLRESGLPIPQEAEIANAILEYEPDPAEGTNFDFFLILTDGRHISFEIKYTETEFGGISPSREDPEKYIRKWETIYRSMTMECPYFQAAGGISMEDFYRHYQICRNIAWAGTRADMAVFLTPRENGALDSGRCRIDSFREPHIRNLYWEELLPQLEELLRDDHRLADYYAAFREKYFEL